MTTTQDLLNSIQAALGTINFSLLQNPQDNDLFEAYVFGIILDATRAEDGRILGYEDIFGRETRDVQFRTSPGYIFTKKPSNQLDPKELYTHAVIQFSDKPPLEVHTGIRVEGKSKVLHECDVAVIARSEGIACRESQVIPRCGKVLLAVECKFYARQVKLDLARAFLGLATDISTHGDGRSEAYFVVNTSSSSCEKLLTKHNKKWEHFVTPSSTREVERLKNAFQKHFRNYQSLD